MEWYIMNSTGVRSLTSSLVDKVSENKYILSDECADSIEELLMKIRSDDHRASVTKRHLLADKLLTKDLFPIIKFASPDVSELQLVLELLAELCEPMGAQQGQASAPPSDVIKDLSKLSHVIRSTFLDKVFIQKMFEKVLHLIQEAGEYEMAREGYECIRDMLALIRNVLYHSSQTENYIQQAALKMLLLKNDLGAILIYSITCHGRDSLVLAVSQILSLIYNKFQWKVNLEEAANPIQELSTDLYINDRLKCLMVKLLQGSLSTLVLSLKKAEHGDPSSSCSNYMSWCLAYFLPFIDQVPVSITKIRGMLSSKLIGYLVYRISMMATNLFFEEAIDATQRQEDENRLMVMFSALENIINVSTSYKLPSLNNAELKIAMQFYKGLVDMTDVWQILLFYIRTFDVTRFPRSFLAQLVCINHKLLSAVEFFNQMSSSRLENTVLLHIKQFASPQVIEQYTSLVSSYTTNSEQTNIAVFTMLCHICVDCDRIDLLYTPTLLRLLGGIMDNTQANDEDRQLAVYVTKSFLEDLAARPELCVESFMNMRHVSMDTMSHESWEQEMSAKADDSSQHSEWGSTEESELLSILSDIGDCADVDAIVNPIASRFEQLGISRSKEEVTDKLRELDFISTSAEEATKQLTDDLSELTRQICEEGNEDFITWIQHGMLTASFIKAMPNDSCFTTSPVCRYSFLLSHSFPVIPCTERQSKLLKSDPKARRLLKSLELSYHEFDGSLIPLISEAKSASELFTMAEKLKVVTTEVSSVDSSVCSSMSSDEDLIEQYISKSAMSSGSQRSEPSFSSSDSNIWLTYMHKISSST